MDETVTLLDVVQLSANLVIFTHCMGNFRLACNIIYTSHQGSALIYGSTLNKQQK